jgi:hypothetical protein
MKGGKMKLCLSCMRRISLFAGKCPYCLEPQGVLGRMFLLLLFLGLLFGVAALYTSHIDRVPKPLPEVSAPIFVPEASKPVPEMSAEEAKDEIRRILGKPRKKTREELKQEIRDLLKIK